MTISNEILFVFKAIVSFVNDMNEIYGQEYKPLRLYALLLERTGIMHEDPIKKHIEAFKLLVTTNADAILQEKTSLLQNAKVEYSEKVCIDLVEIFRLAASDPTNILCIWKHLLTLLLMFEPQRQQELPPKEIRHESEGVEDDFLTNLVQKVGSQIDPSANPMQTVQSMMSTGMFQDIMSSMDNGLQSGNLDMGKMVGSLQKMVGSLSTLVDSQSQQKIE
jgi:hypothetical protein